MSETELKEQVAALQKQVAALQAKIEPTKPSGVSVVSDHRRYDPTENISRLPRSREEMPEWMREMVADPSSSDQMMADIRSDRAPRAQPSTTLADLSK